MGHGLVVDHWIVIVVAILWVVVKGLNQSSINQGIGKSALDYHYHTKLIQNHITVLPHQKLNLYRIVSLIINSETIREEMG